MTMLVLAAATIAAAASRAMATSVPTPSPQGHYAWSVPHQFGPRAPLEAPRHIWVPDRTRTADCDGATGKTSAHDGMASLPGTVPLPSTTTAG